MKVREQQMLAVAVLSEAIENQVGKFLGLVISGAPTEQVQDAELMLSVLTQIRERMASDVAATAPKEVN